MVVMDTLAEDPKDTVMDTINDDLCSKTVGTGLNSQRSLLTKDYRSLLLSSIPARTKENWKRSRGSPLLADRCCCCTKC